MANCSDAFGTITVRGVGREFLKYAKAVYATGGYNLAEEGDMEGVKPAKDLQFTFSTFGRWNFESNLESFLSPDGLWHKNYTDEYEALCEAIKKTNGSIVYEYTDSDGANDWMGKGVAQLELVDGEIRFSKEFEEEQFTIEGYQELYEVNEFDAISQLYGEEVADAWTEYKNDHADADFEDWYSNIYEG